MPAMAGTAEQSLEMGFSFDNPALRGAFSVHLPGHTFGVSWDE